MLPEEILHLPKTQLAQAIDTITLAFQNDGIKAAFIKDPVVRAGLTRWVMTGTLRYCLMYGEVHTTPDVEGVACWLSPGKTDLTTWGMMRAWNRFPGPVLAAGWRAMRQMREMQDRVSEAHKRLAQRPHWYLFVLAVRPEHQGQGHGGRLLAPMLARADRQRLPCYLETQTEENVAFYQKRGFEVLESEDFSNLRLWYMLREPKG